MRNAPNPRHRSVAAVAVLLAFGVLASACGADDAAMPEAPSTTTAPKQTTYGTQVANYDLAVGSRQRVLVGLFSTDGGVVVGGQVTLDFRYLGTAPPATTVATNGPPMAPDIPDVVAVSLPVASGQSPPEGAGPRPREPEDGVAVYETPPMTFDKAGFWALDLEATVGGEPITAPGTFEVLGAHQIIVPGATAPLTANPLAGAPGVPPKAIDSRADADGTVPDPELHAITVADAIATRRPTVVVVSTPVFCVSQFCGPITDTGRAMAQRHAGRVNFVHLEVWQDFEAKALNAAAAEWIYPTPSVEPTEPWVFLIDGTGTIVERWDNVASEGRIEAAVQRLLA